MDSDSSYEPIKLQLSIFHLSLFVTGLNLIGCHELSEINLPMLYMTPQSVTI